MADIKNVDLNLLRVLEVLLDERNVTRAAARLGLTQPTVSGMLSRLREIFGDPLFVRVRRGLEPTPRAEALRPALVKLLADARQLISEPEFRPEAAELTFRVAANDYVQSAFLVEFIQLVQSQAPGVRIALVPMTTTDLAAKLATGHLDLIITYPELVPDVLHQELLYREEHVCAVRAGHPYRGRRISLGRFCEFDHAIISADKASFEGPMDEALRKFGAERNVTVSVPSYSALRDLLEATDMIAITPKRFLDMGGGRLRGFAPPVKLEGFDLVAAWHPRTHGDAGQRWLRGVLFDQATNPDRRPSDRRC